MSFASIAALLIMMIRGGGNELLDYVPTAPYWRIKNVQPTVDHLTADLHALKTDDHSKTTSIRKLMAIRALGESKNPAALPLLQTFVESNEMFVADYARRAIASIQGGPATRPSLPMVQRVSNLRYLPNNVAAVAQINAVGGAVFDVDQFFNSADISDRGDRVAVAETYTRSMLSLAERIGNVRIDSITLGVSDDVAEEAGYAIAAVRGEFDAAAARTVLADASGVEPRSFENFAFYELAGSSAALAADDHLFVLLVGASLGKLPEQQVAALIKSNPKGFSTTPAMAKLLQNVDVRFPVWAAAVITPAYQESTMLAPFEAIRLQAAPNDKSLEIAARGRQREGGDYHAALDEFMQSVNHTQASLSIAVQHAPFLEPAIRFLSTIHTKEEGAIASATGSLRATPEELFRMAVMLDPNVAQLIASSASAPTTAPSH